MRSFPLRLPAVTSVLVLVGTLAAATPAAAEPPAPAPASDLAVPTGAPQRSELTLITGDRVTVEQGGDGRIAADVTPAPRPDGREPQFETIQEDGAAYVVPSDVAVLIPDVLDRELFNVTALAGYPDRAGLPVIVEQADGFGPATVAAGLARVRPLPSVGAVAATVPPGGWPALFPPAAAGGATAPAGVEKVWLDRRVEAALDESVPMVGAPEAWAAGYDGTGMTIAVLDTGIDADHPDLAGKVVGAEVFAEFSDTTEDRHGHGTHVAGIAAGTGAAVDGRYTGVAPGADLLNGKVLADNGNGFTSDIIDGMEWAIAQGADVVNMSLGTSAPSDGTDMLSQAVNDLTAQHDVLFVVAAGNNGRQNGGVSNVGSPGAADAALTVGSVDKQEQLADTSGRGPRPGDYGLKPELTGPGVDIVSARAEGTQAGPVVDEHYTMISGTSMATPHVAGAAALLMQRDAELTAAELKGALTTTAAPNPELDVYQQGGGRLDVPAALAGPVLATPATVDFGYQPYPQQAPSGIEVSYANRGDEPITLDLAVTAASRDGAAAPAAMLSVSPATLTVPAGGTATATVTLDPRQGEYGLYSGTLVATAGGEAVTRSPVGFFKEDERYDLTVEGIARDGRPARGISSARLYNTADTRGVTPLNFVDGQVTYRVAPGTYVAVAHVHTMGESPYTNGLALLITEVEVTADTAVVLDARDAAEVTAEAPAHPDAAPVIGTRVSYRVLGSTIGDSAHSVHVDPHKPIYVSPFTPHALGGFEVYTRWRMSVPDNALSVVEPVTRELAPDLMRGSPRVDGDDRRRLVDAGLGAAEDYQGLDAEGAIVLTARGGGLRYAEKEANARAAGAAALLVSYDVPGHFAGSVGDAAAIPTMGLSYEDGEALRQLLAGGEVTLRLHGSPVKPYLYDLVFVEPDRVRDDLRYVAPDPSELAVVESRFHGHQDGQELSEFRHMWRPWDTISSTNYVPAFAGQDRVDYLTPGDNVWSQRVGARLPTNGANGAVLQERLGSIQAGEHRVQDWFGQVVSPAGQIPIGHSTVDPFVYRPGPALRVNDEIRLDLASWVDAYGHWGTRDSRVDNSSFRLLRDGELLAERAHAQLARFPTVPEAAEYRMELSLARDADWWLMSTRTETAWTVNSARPADGGTEVLPLLRIGHQVPLDRSNTAPAGPVPLTLRVGHQPLTDGPEVAGARAWISRDDGGSWEELSGTDRGDGEFGFQVPATPEDDPTGFVSLRVEAWDAEGNAVEEEVIRAWRAGPALPACDRTIDGRHFGPVLVADGVTCLAGGAVVLGPVVVRPGAGLVATGATVYGGVAATGATTVHLAGSRVAGPVALVDNHTGDAPPVVSGNTIVGPLACHGNEPPPTDLDVPNRVTGPVTGQCAGF